MPDISNLNIDNSIDRAIQNPGSVRKAKIADKNQSIDRDGFLKLLITELSHQDPINPLNDREFISQMAQFSALEQMHNVAESVNSMKSLQANSFVGKQVTGSDFISHRTVTGVITRIVFDKSGSVFLKTNNNTIRLDDLISVEDVPKPVEQPVNVSRETLEKNNDNDLNKKTLNTINSNSLNEYQKNQQMNTEKGVYEL